MSPILSGSSALQRFEFGNTVEIRNRIMFDFYLGLPHYVFIIYIYIYICSTSPVTTRISTCGPLASGLPLVMDSRLAPSVPIGSSTTDVNCPGQAEPPTWSIELLALVNVLTFLSLFFCPTLQENYWLATHCQPWLGGSSITGVAGWCWSMAIMWAACWCVMCVYLKCRRLGSCLSLGLRRIPIYLVTKYHE